MGDLPPRWIAVVWILSGALPWSAVAQKAVRGDNSGLPRVDYSKQFEVKSFDRFNTQFETRSLDMKTADLPVYSGNLRSLPLPEWQSSSRADIYQKFIAPRDFEIKKAIDSWSRPLALKAEPAFPQQPSPLDGKETGLSSSVVETDHISPGPDLQGDELREVINRGSEIGAVTAGRGFQKIKLKPGLKEPPGTTSPPKSAPSR